MASKKKAPRSKQKRPVAKKTTARKSAAFPLHSRRELPEITALSNRTSFISTTRPRSPPMSAASIQRVRTCSMPTDRELAPPTEEPEELGLSEVGDGPPDEPLPQDGDENLPRAG